jgi:hypothetical protein
MRLNSMLKRGVMCMTANRAGSGPLVAAVDDVPPDVAVVLPDVAGSSSGSAIGYRECGELGCKLSECLVQLRSRLFVLRALRAAVRPLTAMAAGAEQAAWSPDGSSIVFMSGGAVYLATVGGSGAAVKINLP